VRAGRDVRKGGLHGRTLFVAAATPARPWGRVHKSRAYAIALCECCEACAAIEIAGALGACSAADVLAVVALGTRTKNILSRLVR
jgi:hypothetical protein